MDDTTIATQQELWSLPKKLIALGFVVLIGILLAVVWNHEVVDPLALQFQQFVVRTTAVSNSTLAIFLAFISGMSMIITACGWPMILNLTAMAQESKSRTSWLISIGLYTLGLMIVMALVGALFGFFGGIFVNALVQTTTKLAVTTFVYTIVGVYALLGALQEFGFINLPWLLPWLKQPRFVSGLKGYKQSFVLGAVIGGGFGVGCPFPTYHAVLAFIAAIGSPVVGATALAANAVGRVIPIFIVGSLILGGLGAPKVFAWIQRRSETIHMVNGLALALLGVFMIVYWTILVGSKVFLK